RNTIHVLPRKDVTLTVTFEKDAYQGTIELKDTASAYYKDTVTMEAYAEGTSANPVATLALGTIATANDGKYTIKSLNTGSSYDIWVNGYKAATISDATTTVITMDKITLEVWLDGSASTSTADHRATITGTFAPNHSAKPGPIYLPAGAVLTAPLKLSATANTGFRVNTATDTLKAWSMTSSGGMIAGNDAAGYTYTHTLAGDVVLRANFTTTYTVKAAPGIGGTVKITAPDTTNLATVDKGKSATVVAEATAGTALNDYAFAAWTEKTDTGAWWTTAVDTTVEANPAATAFYAPTANAEVTASFKNLAATGLNGAVTDVTWSATDGITITAKVGYAAQTVKVRLENNASARTGMLSVSTGADAANAFAEGKLDSTADLVISGFTFVSIATETGKAAGTYTTTVTVT
ncbi:MAG: hypothetical protein RSB55_09865, partial [Oscillospiraceae bacterium]